MEFTIHCPVDGEIDVELDDVKAVVIREPERVDITFVCPECGSEITVAAIVPAFLLAAMEALAADGDDSEASMVVVGPGRETPSPGQSIHMDASTAEAYCEYFRRQLEHVECVEDALDEIDSRP